jgi:hypothetical protein
MGHVLLLRGRVSVHNGLRAAKIERRGTRAEVEGGGSGVVEVLFVSEGEWLGWEAGRFVVWAAGDFDSGHNIHRRVAVLPGILFQRAVSIWVAAIVGAVRHVDIGFVAGLHGVGGKSQHYLGAHWDIVCQTQHLPQICGLCYLGADYCASGKPKDAVDEADL